MKSKHCQHNWLSLKTFANLSSATINRGKLNLKVTASEIATYHPDASGMAKFSADQDVS